MQVSGFRIYFLEPGYFFSKILSEFRKKIVALQLRCQLDYENTRIIGKLQKNAARFYAECREKCALLLHC